MIILNNNKYFQYQFPEYIQVLETFLIYIKINSK